MEHSAGPWVFEGENSAMPVLCLYCADNKSPFHGSRSEEELKANARLIAAAPELLNAAVVALAVIAKQYVTKDGLDAAMMLKEAIAKATDEC